MDSPERRVSESEVGDKYVVRVHQFKEVASSVLQCSVPPHLPPHLPSTINCPIFSYNHISKWTDQQLVILDFGNWKHLGKSRSFRVQWVMLSSLKMKPPKRTKNTLKQGYGSLSDMFSRIHLASVFCYSHIQWTIHENSFIVNEMPKLLYRQFIWTLVKKVSYFGEFACSWDEKDELDN